MISKPTQETTAWRICVTPTNLRGALYLIQTGFWHFLTVILTWQKSATPPCLPGPKTFHHVGGLLFASLIFLELMSFLPSLLGQSSLGEKCAFYLDSVAGNIPVSLHTLGRQVASNFQSLRSSYPLRSLSQSLGLDLSDQDTALLTVFVCLLTVILMSWRSPFGFLRRSPYPNSSTPPRVSDSDYSYLTPDDIVDPPSHSYRQQYAGAGDTEPDMLLLKHRENNYRLQFPAYAIDDGMLSVGQLRRHAAEVTNTLDPNRIKLLYKGKLLNNDSLPLKAEGLKQHSEVVCVVSEVPGDRTPSDVSDAEADWTSGSVRLDDGSGFASGSDRGPKRKNKRSKGKGKNKNKNKQADPHPVDPNTLAPPPMAKQPSSPGRSAPSPSPSLKEFRTPLDQVNMLTSYFRNELMPFCDEYVNNTPTDPKVRDFEHKRLGETILTQVILKADGVEPDDDSEARQARRALIKETQAALSRLDKAREE